MPIAIRSWCLAGLLGFLASGTAAAPPSEDSVRAFAENPMSYFFELRTAEALEAGQILLADAGFSGRSRADVLTALGAIHLAGGREAQARAAFLEILRADPGFEPSRPELLPPPVAGLYFGLRDSLVLSVDAPPAFDIRTLAVGDVENNSIMKGAFDLDRFARGLTHIMISDLKDTTPLRIVDRQRLGVIRQEIAMSSGDQITDPRYRVPIGRLTGAQSFLFGSILQAAKDKVRLDLRWVDTSTGEILLAEGVEAKLKSSDDLFKLERKVLLELMLPRIHAMTGGMEGGSDVKQAIESHIDGKKKRLSDGSAYVDLLLKTGEAILAEERGDLAAAREAWREVGAMNPADATASERAVALNAWMGIGGEDQ